MKNIYIKPETKIYELELQGVIASSIGEMPIKPGNSGAAGTNRFGGSDDDIF
ncbi:MAG: hypothetical protein J6R91_06490 [Bacteroidaceae bacterium]|nr:hypothetical protein [Bacteroidaceae bacterium]